jgi:hypothetical protein
MDCLTQLELWYGGNGFVLGCGLSSVKVTESLWMDVDSLEGGNTDKAQW